ncbi:MAG: ribonuclease R [Lachnospiraceae bacterium]
MEPIIITGTFVSNIKGFGFVKSDELEQDVYIAEANVNQAFHNDIVRCQIVSEATNEKRMEGVILEVLERGYTEIVGTFDPCKNYGFVIPDNLRFSKDIYLPAEACKGLVAGHKVVVNIVDYGDDHHNPVGEIQEVLGHIDDPGVDILSVVKVYQIPIAFPDEVEEQLRSIPDEIDSSEISLRRDLRDWDTVTIDGADAKDLDDAITIRRIEEGYELGVHIADVTHYVRENSPLDRQARKRGTSVYLLDRVIPMLPHQLSNGICSLNEGVDRLALSCIMRINGKGEVFDHEVCESVIRVNRRMTYDSVKRIIIDHDQKESQKYLELVPMFELMYELSGIIRQQRQKRGSIDFDFPETKIELDDLGFPTYIAPYERNAAHLIIEDFMLLANETIAEDYYWQEVPFLYRTHEAPDEEKIQTLKVLIQNFGYFLKSSKDEIHPKEIQKLLAKIEGTPEEPFISRIALRSMKQAKYTVNNIGHFGLSAKFYTHFTSPIRRYPDLQIHRIIKELLHGDYSQKRLEHYQAILPKVAEDSSALERRAEEAEREVIKMKKVEYMSERLGQVYKGMISGVTQWGFFVELPNTIEGMVHVSTLDDDFYFYDPQRYVMIGEHTHKEYKMGQSVTIRVIGVDMEMKTIDFEIYERKR